MDSCIYEIATSAGIEPAQSKLLPGGEQGAWEVADADGTRYVLKTHPDPGFRLQFARAAETTARLRNVAYPAPRYLATGATPSAAYALIETLPGDPDRPVTSETLRQLISLNGLQQGRAARCNSDWIPGMVDSVMSGRAGYCLVDTLNDHSPGAADLLDQLRRIAASAQQREVFCNDIVHFDFHPANVLSDTRRVTGIIDWEGTCAGDASFDLATMLFYCYDNRDVRTTLTAEIMKRSGPSALGLYLAHVILRQVDWSIRYHHSHTADHFLSRAYRILTDLPGAA